MRGSAFFQEFAPTRLAGSSLGGSFLRLRSAYAGFCVEFALERRVIITMPVRSITVAPAPSPTA